MVLQKVTHRTTGISTLLALLRLITGIQPATSEKKLTFMYVTNVLSCNLTVYLTVRSLPIYTGRGYKKAFQGKFQSST